MNQPPGFFFLQKKSILLCLVISMTLLACVISSPPIPTKKVAGNDKPQPVGSGEWGLEELRSYPEPNPGPNKNCYFNQDVMIGDGAFSSSDSWKEEGCTSAGPGFSGSRQIVCSWTLPPSPLKVGSTLSLTTTCQAFDQRNGGGASASGGGQIYLTVNPPANNLGARLSSSIKFGDSTVASVSGNQSSISVSKTGSVVIPAGRASDILVIVASFNGPGGGGYVVYKYGYETTNKPPIRPAPITVAPIKPQPNPITITPTLTRTITPTRTGTPIALTPTRTTGRVEEEFFAVRSYNAAYNNPTKPTTFTITDSWLVTFLLTYHWNNGAGAKPGTISLRAADGKLYGPWQATGNVVNNTVQNGAWVVRPNIVIPPGTYTVIDSDPATWSHNPETGGMGMAWGSGIRGSK